MLRIILLCGLLLCWATGFAGTWSGLFSYGTGKVISEGDSAGVYGARVAARYLPDDWRWQKVDIFMSGSLAYWRTSNNAPNKNITIAAVAPVLRYYVWAQQTYQPFIEGSVGAAYFSRLKFNNRDLGIHFTFQDMLGFGATFGSQKRWSASLRIMHYSNAGIAKSNGGLTVPMVFSVGYTF